MEPKLDDSGVGAVDYVLTKHGDDGEPTDASTCALDDSLLSIASFEDFYRNERVRIARALAMTLRDTELATEAVDEAMARAYQRWNRIRSFDNPAGWVYRVALNWSRSVLHRRGRPAPIWVSGPGSTPGVLIADPLIDQALGELAVSQRAVVVCRLLLGYSEAQTAAALKIRPGTVKSRLSRALAALEPRLSQLHDDTTP